MNARRYGLSVLFLIIISLSHISVFGYPFARMDLPDVHQHLYALAGGDVVYSRWFYAPLRLLAVVVGPVAAYVLVSSAVAFLPAEAAAGLAGGLWGRRVDADRTWALVCATWAPWFIFSTGTLAAGLHLSLLLFAATELFIKRGGIRGQILLGVSALVHSAGAPFSFVLALFWGAPLSAGMAGYAVLSPSVPVRGHAVAVSGLLHWDAVFNGVTWLLVPLFFARRSSFIREKGLMKFVYIPVLIAVFASPVDANLRPLLHAGVFLSVIGGAWVHENEIPLLMAFVSLGFFLYWVGTLGANHLLYSIV